MSEIGEDTSTDTESADSETVPVEREILLADDTLWRARYLSSETEEKVRWQESISIEQLENMISSTEAAHLYLKHAHPDHSLTEDELAFVGEALENADGVAKAILRERDERGLGVE